MELWCEDEARLGLLPTTRRVWVPKGSHPIAPSNTKYQWLYVYAFIRPKNGESFWLLLPTVNAAIMTIALQAFVDDIDPKRKRIMVLLLDQAGFHTTNTLVIPDNIIIRYFPSHTPELQPVESAWSVLREATHNRLFEDLSALENTIVRRCQYLMDHREIVYGKAGFSWACAMS